MKAIDEELAARAAAGRPIRVALVGAGVTGRTIALQLLTPVPGIRLAAVVNRTLSRAELAWQQGGDIQPTLVHDGRALDDAVRRGVPRWRRTRPRCSTPSRLTSWSRRPAPWNSAPMSCNARSRAASMWCS
jgi:hypothetical protein